MHEEVANLAAEFGHVEIVKYLADLPSEKQNPFTSTLNIAAKYGQDVVDFLLYGHALKSRPVSRNL